MRDRRAADTAKGFSLIEVLIAQALLSIGLLSLAQLFGVAVWHDTNARIQTLAITLAQQKMEGLSAQYAAGIMPTGGEDTVRIDNEAPDSTAQVVAMFKIVWSIQPQPRGACTLQIKLIPWQGSARPAPGAAWSSALVFRTALTPLRR